MFAQMDGFVVPNTIFARTSEIVEILDAGYVFAHPTCTNVRSLRARCAKPPFCDADGNEADSYDDEGGAHKRCIDYLQQTASTRYTIVILQNMCF